MPIPVSCSSCGARLRVADSAAGKRVKCPKCGVRIPVPPPADDEEPEEVAVQAASPRRSASVEAIQTIPCPYCSEPIQPTARKCKHCGELLDPVLRAAAEGLPEVPQSFTAPADGQSRAVNALLGVLLIVSMFACCCGLPVYWVHHEAQQAAELLAKADQLYAAGNRDQAVAVYKEHFSHARDKPQTLKRIVETEVAKGNTAEARKWIQRGLSEKIDATYDSVEAQGLVAQIKREEEERVAKQKAEEEAREKQRKVQAAQEEKRANEERLFLIQESLTGESDASGGVHIKGTVVNRTKRKYSYVAITFNIYDESEARIGTARANINGLEPGERWNFEAIGFVPDVRTFKFKVSELSGL